MPDITTPFLSVTQIGFVPVVMAVVQIFKTVGLPDRFAPLYALVLGIGGAFLLPSDTVQLTIIAGLTIGCIAAGVYSGVKATVQG